MDYNKASIDRINRNAKRLGVTVKRSQRRFKKFDVYRNGIYVTSIGDNRYKDYHLYIQSIGLAEARKRREAYLARHNKNIAIEGSTGHYAAAILWA